MRKNIWFFVTVAVLVAGASAYLGRGHLRDAYDAWRAPELPPAVPYQPTVRPVSSPSVPEGPSPFEPGHSTSENFILETSPVVKAQPGGIDLLAYEGPIPASVNLDVPFTTQAPFTNWDMPYQEACEEASAIMVDAFYRGLTGTMEPLEADGAILKLVAYQKMTLGFYEDTTSEELAQVIRDYFGYRDVEVRPFGTGDDLKKVLAQGYPVIVPMAGKLLGNPNFRNGGPLYHMLVVRGYTPDYFITNDPGTRKGEGYTYDEATILNAAHDWNGGNVTEGERLMIVVLPNP
ncbi:C39 family peptidase [Candidatus Uhrbacteria bacterium]|nr:C39 family peptidase [Candidatus Uhrbacteria bacterium]